MTSSSRFSIALLSLSLSLLTGCTLATTAVDGPQAFVPLSGVVMGAETPIINASIVMYDASVSSTGGANTYGGAPLELASATTSSVLGSQGSFTLAQYDSNVCSASTDQLYIVSTGGDAGGGTNAAGTLIAALGSCGNINSNTQVYMNEATTIAAAYGLSGFAYPDGSSINIGAPVSNLVGLQHAMNNALNLVNYNGQTRGATVSGNGLVPTALINMLANSLAGCVNSSSGNGPGSTGCSPIEVAPPAVISTVSCATTSCIPNNTWQIALQWALYPGWNVAKVFANVGLYGSGFYSPTLANEPSDLSIAITYSTGFQTGGSKATNTPQDIKADGSGNLWVTGMTGAQLVELGPDGTVESPSGGVLDSVGGNSVNLFSVAVDSSGNVWSIDPGTQSAPTTAGNLWEYVPATVAGSSGTGAKIPLPSSTLGSGSVMIPPYGDAIGIDLHGNVWYGTYITTSAGNTNAFNEYFPGTGYASFTVSTIPPYSTKSKGFQYLTVDATTGNIWSGYIDGPEIGYLTATAGAYTTAAAATGATSASNVYGSAIDGSGNAWFVGEGSTTDDTGSLYEIAKGAIATSTRITGPGTPGLTEPSSIEFDGIGRMFIPVMGSTKTGNTQGGGLAEYDPANSTWLMTTGTSTYTPFEPVDSTGAAVLLHGGPTAVTIDQAGAVWTVNNVSSGRPVVQILGVGAPTVAPLAAGKYGICAGTTATTSCATTDGRP